MTVRRGIPTTMNTPALDPVLMWDGRQPDLESQALSAVKDHAQPAYLPSTADLDRLRTFQLSTEFFSSPELAAYAAGGLAPELPAGNTDAEKRGRRFFEDVIDLRDGKHGLCASCHSGPMLNQTNRLLRLLFGVPPGTRFQSVLVSELNTAGNPVQRFVFNEGKWNESRVESPDIGRSAITGVRPEADWSGSHFNAFKISQLRGIRDTGPYFHDNSAKTLEDVMLHYAKFFAATRGGIILTPQDQADVVAFMKLLR
jgi:cytochrome c peroxidase